MRRFKTRLSRKTKIFAVVNTILIVYIFSLTIGYSLLGEKLKITGSANADNPDLSICPINLNTTNMGNAVIGTLGSNGFERYFLEKQDYNLLYIENEKDSIAPSSIIDFYDNDINTYSLLVSNTNLYSNSSKNILNTCSESLSCPINEYKTLSKPIYIVLENETSYPLEKFIIKRDYDILPNYPVSNIDIRWKKYNSLSDITNDIINSSNDIDLYNSFNSIFDGTITSSGNGTYGNYYSYSDFYNLNQLSFETDKIEYEQFIVLAVYFGDIENASYKEDEITRDDDGISFKFWEEKFSEESAFKIRFAFTSYDNVKGFYDENVNAEFYSNPSNYTYPVSWFNSDNNIN